MSPDDPRHGSNRGYGAGCRLDCCRTAHAAYRKQRRHDMRDQGLDSLITDGRETRRQIRALMAAGWTLRDIDRRLGRQPTYTFKLLNHGGNVYLTTAQMYAALYAEHRSPRLEPEKPCGCHPHMPNERTLDGWACMGCGWGGRVDVHLSAGDVRPPRQAEVEPVHVALEMEAAA